MSPITTDFDAVLSWPLTLAICASIIAAASTEFSIECVRVITRLQHGLQRSQRFASTRYLRNHLSHRITESKRIRPVRYLIRRTAENASSKGVTMRYQPEICRCSVFAPDRQVTGSHGAPPSVAEAAASGAVVAYRRRLRVPHIVPELTPAQVWPAALIEVMIMWLTSSSCVSSRSS